METILSGNALWSFDFEVLNRNRTGDIIFHVSGVKPFHCHSGEIILTDNSIKITGDSDLAIMLNDLKQLYLGFDETFTESLSKNFGLFWKPLRLTLDNDHVLYLIIDYNFIGSKNKLWFETLQDLLS